MLVLWRNWLRRSDVAYRIVKTVRKLIATTCAIKDKRRWVLDSTALHNSVARQSKVTMLRV